MINLAKAADPSSLVHTVPIDPGKCWSSDCVAIEAPPDGETSPSPEAQWPAEAVRSGICGSVGPRVVALPGGGYRLYYTQILPRPDFPTGANDYGNATSRILSATSNDGVKWNPEPGVRLSARDGGAGDFRVVSSEVVPAIGGRNKLRMYFECCRGPQSKQNAIRSAVSDDGLHWTVEDGSRLEFSSRNLSAPRIAFLSDGRCRLYCAERGTGIISALSEDGLTFQREPGIRLAPSLPFDRLTAFAPEILRIESDGYRMYYAGYSDMKRADILTATSEDGLNWEKEHQPVHSPGTKPWNAAKCSEMCVIWDPQQPHDRSQFRMLYEACDGTAKDQRGVWRIASAVAQSGD